MGHLVILRVNGREGSLTHTHMLMQATKGHAVTRRTNIQRGSNSLLMSNRSHGQVVAGDQLLPLRQEIKFPSPRCEPHVRVYMYSERKG